ncbi:MAG: DNA-binding response regulator [Lachnospiraceae bacterium]|nr:DNA-binding response regulator [Lachnospiraceae bacterium]
MERYILTICDDKIIFKNLRKKWLEEGITVHMASNFSNAANELSENPAFLLIVVFLDEWNSMPSFYIIRKTTKAPILVLRKGYDSIEKAAMSEAGADEYIAWTDNYLIETIASGKALIRRYTEFSQATSQPFRVLSHGSLFMSADYRKVFINVQEIVLSRREFDLLYFREQRARRPCLHGHLATAARVESLI